MKSRKEFQAQGHSRFCRIGCICGMGKQHAESPVRLTVEDQPETAQEES